MKQLLSYLLLAVGSAGALGLCAGPPDAQAQIRKVMDDQVSAWNRGDLKDFMQSYWKSPQTTFSGANGTLRGWPAVVARFEREYPNRQAMGTLTYPRLDITLLAPDAALVRGEFSLARANDHPAGVFTVVLRKFPEGWRIIHDHTSVVSR